MKKIVFLLLGFGFLFLALADRGLTKEITGQEIMAKVAFGQRGVKAEKVEIEATLENQKGKKEVRELTAIAQYGKEDNIRIDIKSPAALKGTKFLMQGKNQWLYNPTLKRALKIAGSARQQRFAESDFTYEDLEPENAAKQSYELIGQENIGWDLWVIKATARSLSESAYGFRKLWVEKENFIVIKTEYYDKESRLQKVRLEYEIKKWADVWRAGKTVMKDIANKQTTTLVFKNRVVNVEISEAMFNPRNLEAE